MKKDGYYSSGQFMKLTHVTKKTIRYYDEHNILKPSYVNASGARFYTNHDLAKMQQILLLKNLGFSLSDIREITVNDANSDFMESSLALQKKLIEHRIEQLQIISKAISETTSAIHNKEEVDWSKMLELIHAMGMEQSLKTQYQNASNISARIHLHSLYSTNKQGWFPWIYEQYPLQEGMQVLELGCGDGSFWKDNFKQLPEQIQIHLSDISDGMLRDAKNNIGAYDKRFSYLRFDAHHIPYEDASFDFVIANHLLFYCDDISAVCKEVKRVLKKGGRFLCSTYSGKHMQEVRQLVTSFDDRIILSAENLYERFGPENGFAILAPYFSAVQWKPYEDSLFVPEIDALISYILSCHGNQTQYILDRYKDFRSFMQKSMGKGFSITKDSGIFLCQK